MVVEHSKLEFVGQNATPDHAEGGLARGERDRDEPVTARRLRSAQISNVDRGRWKLSPSPAATVPLANVAGMNSNNFAFENSTFSSMASRYAETSVTTGGSRDALPIPGHH